MRNFVQPGNAVTVPAPGATNSGSGVLIGHLFGVAGTDAAEGDDLVLHCAGVYDLPKVAEDAFTLGARVYWDGANDECTSTAEGNFLIGVAVAAAGSGASALRVRLADALVVEIPTPG